MNSAKYFFSFLFFSFAVFDSPAQILFRVKADFSVKETLSGGKSRLVTGKVYYDKNYRKIVYDISFPEKEIILICDSILLRVSDGRILERSKMVVPNEFSIFHLCLNSRLSDFGLKNSLYQIEKVEKESGMVITSWVPPPKFSDRLGKVMVSQKEKRLFGIVFFNPKNQIAGKEFFKNYSNISGMEFPGEIIHISYSGGEEFYKVTTFRNIVADDIQNENLYNFPVPE